MPGGISWARCLIGDFLVTESAGVPAITADALQDSTIEDLVFFLEIGMTPEGDFARGHMTAVVEQGTAHLSSADHQVMAEYLQSTSNGGIK